MRYLIVFILLINGCVSKSQEKCDSYNNAKSELANYGRTSDKSFLTKALLSLDTALSCPDTRKLAIQKKIQIFTILETYDNAIKFMNTIDAGEFEYPYQKNMYTNYFKSKAYTLENNINNRDSVIKQSIQEIKTFIDKQNYDNPKAGFTVYSNLFFMETRIYDSIRINQDIDSLKIRYQNDDSTIESLREIALKSID